MGSRPYAVLAYGYDLTEDFNLYDKPVPAWFDDSEASVRDNACRALMAAKGKTVAPDEYFDPEDQDLCGIVLVKLGQGSDDPVILAAKVHKTDWDSTETISHFVPPGTADENLRWALGVLGIDPGQRLPQWILGAYMG